jgi:hypothetical protein
VATSSSSGERGSHSSSSRSREALLPRETTPVLALGHRPIHVDHGIHEAYRRVIPLEEHVHVAEAWIHVGMTSTLRVMTGCIRLEERVPEADGRDLLLHRPIGVVGKGTTQPHDPGHEAERMDDPGASGHSSASCMRS